MRLKHASLGVALLAAACTSTGGIAPATDGGMQQANPLVVAVGTGSLQFEPLKTGDPVSIIHGPQGGTHIWGAVQLTHAAPGTATVTYTVTTPAGVLSSTPYVLDVSGDPWSWAGLIGVVPDPSAIDGQDVTLSVSVTDAAGHTGLDQRQVVAHDSPTNMGGGVGSSAPVPTPRGDFAAAIDGASEQLILFGGDVGVPVQCMPQPSFSPETWLLDLKTHTWKQVTGDGPPARARHAGIIDSKRHRFVIFGGRYRQASSGLYTVYNDVWAFDFESNGWTQLQTTGAAPPGLANTLAAYDATGDRMIVYGGNSSASGLSFAPHSETWALNFADNSWSKLGMNASEVPPAREYHTGTLDQVNHRLIVFGGGDANAFQGPFYNDLWAFDLAGENWTKLSTGGTAPQGRIRAQLVLDSERNRVLVFGGHDDAEMGERNDLWAFQLDQGAWSRLNAGDKLNAQGQGFCDFPPDFTTPALDSPERREAHFLGLDVTAKQFVLYGGTTDCGNIGDGWTLDPASGQWSSFQRSYVGESCPRSGRQGCMSLCL